MYYLVNTETKDTHDQSGIFLDLWLQLDRHTLLGNSVVITDDSDEIRGGNALGYQDTIHLNKIHIERRK